jgi:excisionase family DNA binding protein
MGQPRYLDTRQAAAYLGLSLKTLEKLRVTGRGPRFAKAGRKVIYDRRDLDRWVAALKRGFTGESVDADEPCREDGDDSEDEDGSEEEDESCREGGDGSEDDSGVGEEDGSEDDSGRGT